MGFFKSPKKINVSDHYSRRVVINARILTAIILAMGVYGISHVLAHDGMPHYAWLISYLGGSIFFVVAFYPIVLVMSCTAISLGNSLFNLAIVLLVVAREKMLNYIYGIDE